MEDADAERSRAGAGKIVKVSSLASGGADADGATDSAALAGAGRAGDRATGRYSVGAMGMSGFDYSAFVRKSATGGTAAQQKAGKKKKKKKGTLKREKTSLFF